MAIFGLAWKWEIHAGPLRVSLKEIKICSIAIVSTCLHSFLTAFPFVFRQSDNDIFCTAWIFHFHAEPKNAHFLPSSFWSNLSALTQLHSSSIVLFSNLYLILILTVGDWKLRGYVVSFIYIFSLYRLLQRSADPGLRSSRRRSVTHRCFGQFVDAVVSADDGRLHSRWQTSASGNR